MFQSLNGFSMILISTVIIIISFVLSLPLPYYTNLFNFIETCSIISAIYFPSFLSFRYLFRYSFWTGFFVVAVFFEFCPEFCAGSIIQSVLAIRALRQFSYDLALLPAESNRSILRHCITSFNFSLSNYLIQEDFRKPELAGFDFVSLPLPSFLTV